jgi:hypothetical protein
MDYSRDEDNYNSIIVKMATVLSSIQDVNQIKYNSLLVQCTVQSESKK